MSLSREEKQSLMEKFARAKGETGSPEVQVALLTHDITKLSQHLKLHTHDFHSRHGLLKMVGKRRRLLSYLKREDENRYGNLIKELGLRK